MIEQQGGKVILPKSYWEDLEKCKEELDRMTGLFPDAPQPEEAVNRMLVEVDTLRKQNDAIKKTAVAKINAAVTNENQARKWAEETVASNAKSLSLALADAERKHKELTWARESVTELEATVNDLYDRINGKTTHGKIVVDRKYDDIPVPREWFLGVIVDLERIADEAATKHRRGASSPAMDAGQLGNLIYTLREMASVYKTPQYNHNTRDDYDRYTTDWGPDTYGKDESL